MKGDLILHKEHGLNPTMPVCIYCGEDKGEIVLLGNAYKGEAPMKMIIDNEPCDTCREKMDSGEWKGFLGECEHNGLIKTEALKDMFDPETFETLKDSPIFRMEKCFQCMGVTE